jgi:hypothetical protein
MSLPDRDLGIISVFLKRFETEDLPAMLSMKTRVEAGETLSDGDILHLHRVFEDVQSTHAAALLEHHPEYRELAGAVFYTYRTILDRAIANEKAHQELE